jgi:hypothetical protein
MGYGTGPPTLQYFKLNNSIVFNIFYYHVFIRRQVCNFFVARPRYKRKVIILFPFFVCAGIWSCLYRGTFLLCTGIVVSATYVQGEHSNFERYVPIKNFFCGHTILTNLILKWPHALWLSSHQNVQVYLILSLRKKINVIFFLIFWALWYFFYYIKMFLKNLFQNNYLLK